MGRWGSLRGSRCSTGWNSRCMIASLLSDVVVDIGTSSLVPVAKHCNFIKFLLDCTSGHSQECILPICRVMVIIFERLRRCFGNEGYIMWSSPGWSVRMLHAVLWIQSTTLSTHVKRKRFCECWNVCTWRSCRLCKAWALTISVDSGNSFIVACKSTESRTAKSQCVSAMHVALLLEVTNMAVSPKLSPSVIKAIISPTEFRITTFP